MASKTGLGSCTLWGLTPALNLLTFLDDKTLIEADNDKKGINILLFGQADCRHIFKTLEEHLNFRTRKIKINVFIIESNIELYARQLLFLTLASLPLEKIGLYEKTRQFVEIFGNTNLRPRTQHSLIKLARRLVKMLTDEDYLEKKMPFVNLSDLKFVERDALVEICKYWMEYCDIRKENLMEKWDKRLRYYLGSRYDSRSGVFDWDYHMRLKDLGIDIISSVEYKNWRGKGMAFTDYDSEYSQPNVTLCSGASLTSNWKNVCFLGEIITGPFIAYGIECDDKTFFEKANDRNKFSAGDVTIHNLEKVFSTFGGMCAEPGGKTDNDGRGDVQGMQGNGDPKNLSDVFSVTFLPMESAKHLHLKSQFLNKFHLVYFSSTMAQHLTPDITPVFTKETVVIVEGVRYLFELRDDHIKAYNDKVQNLAESAKLYKLPEGHETSHVDYLSYTTVPPTPSVSNQPVDNEDECGDGDAAVVSSV
jgi:dynein assembly factor 3